MNEQKELTKAELQIMQVLWQKENAFVNEILQELEEPRPAIIQFLPCCVCCKTKVL